MNKILNQFKEVAMEASGNEGNTEGFTFLKNCHVTQKMVILDWSDGLAAIYADGHKAQRCTCKDDADPICKHINALGFLVSQEFAEPSQVTCENDPYSHIHI